LLGELDVAAQEHGLVCPVGVVSHTGVGGLTLGGGMGRLQRKHGFTIDNLRAVEVVTADGQQVRADETENAELFWGMRGAGANFGVVTAFEFDLHPYDGALTVAYAVHTGDRIAEAWASYRDFMATAPDHMMVSFNMGRAWDGLVPDEMVGKSIVKITAFHSGDVDAAADELRPLTGSGSPVATAHDVMRYLDVQRLADEESAWGHRVYTKGGFTNDLPAAALESMVEHLGGAADSDLFGVWSQGGQIARVAEDAMAFTGRSAPFQMSSEASWDDPADDENRIGWTRAAFAIAEPYSATGRYVNDVSDSGADLARSIYGDAKYDRLLAVKRAWDPDNVFRLNQNIKP
jgi:FAD/FMN-containing dehydrogenase